VRYLTVTPQVTVRYLTVTPQVTVRYLTVTPLVTVRYLTVTPRVAARYPAVTFETGPAADLPPRWFACAPSLGPRADRPRTQAHPPRFLGVPKKNREGFAPYSSGDPPWPSPALGKAGSPSTVVHLKWGPHLWGTKNLDGWLCVFLKKGGRSAEGGLQVRGLDLPILA